MIVSILQDKNLHFMQIDLLVKFLLVFILALILKNVGHFGLRHPIPMVTIREKFLKKVKIVLCVFNQVMV